MPEPASAQIIPFPGRPTTRNAVLDPPRGEIFRLNRARQGVDAAVIDQRAAIAAWRDSLATLGHARAGLGAGVTRYHTSLTALDADVTALSGHARALVRWANGPLRVIAEG